MKLLLTGFSFLLALCAWADLSYMPLKMTVKAHKAVVMEGELIGFQITLFNVDKTNAYPILIPEYQTFGEKLIYFNLYPNQQINGLPIETESRVMSNAMVHDIAHYPKTINLKPLDSISFDVFFNGSLMQTAAHHWFETPLFAGKYKFQAIYNPLGTVVGDSLYHFLSSTHDKQAPDKLNFFVDGMVSFPVNVTILKSPNSVINIGKKTYSSEKKGESTFRYTDQEGQVFDHEVTSDLFPNTTPKSIETIPISLFAMDKKCKANCDFCYAVTQGEADYLEHVIKRKIRKLKHAENGLNELLAWLNTHEKVDFATMYGEMLSSLPSYAVLDIGLNESHAVVLRKLYLKVGRIGHIPYYSFKNRSMSRKTDPNILTFKGLTEPPYPLPEYLGIEKDNTNAYQLTRDSLPLVIPELSYFYALQTKHPELGLSSYYSINHYLYQDKEQLRRKLDSKQDAAALCFKLALANDIEKAELLETIRENRQLACVPYLISCVENYLKCDISVFKGQEAYLASLCSTLNHLLQTTVYSNQKKPTTLDLLRVGLPVWQQKYRFTDSIQATEMAVLILEAGLGQTKH